MSDKKIKPIDNFLLLLLLLFCNPLDPNHNH